MGHRILIADDEVYIRVLLEQTLERLENVDIELMLATNGQEAWELVQSQQPDLVILDVNMPHMSGYEVCQKIKSTPGLADTYVIILTARGQERDRRHSVEVKADEYITKPFHPAHLIARITHVLGIS
ncbi:MAG: response regulator [Anaerolineae bacterium]|nr:response regulator [Anaerolineae bacterium]